MYTIPRNEPHVQRFVPRHRPTRLFAHLGDAPILTAEDELARRVREAPKEVKLTAQDFAQNADRELYVTRDLDPNAPWKSWSGKLPAIQTATLQAADLMLGNTGANVGGAVGTAATAPWIALLPISPTLKAAALLASGAAWSMTGGAFQQRFERALTDADTYERNMQAREDFRSRNPIAAPFLENATGLGFTRLGVPSGVSHLGGTVASGALGAGSELVNNYVSDRPLFTPRVGTSAFWSSLQTHPTQVQHALDAGMERTAQSTVRRLGNTPVGRFASFATAPVDPVAKRTLDTGTRVPSFQGTGTPSFSRPGDMFRRPGDLFRRVQPAPVGGRAHGIPHGVVSDSQSRLIRSAPKPSDSGDSTNPSAGKHRKPTANVGSIHPSGVANPVPGAEAAANWTLPNRYATDKEAASRLQELGIAYVEFNGNTSIANMVCEFLEQLHSYQQMATEKTELPPLPDVVKVHPEWFNDPRHKVRSTAPAAVERTFLYLNPEHAYWKDPVEYVAMLQQQKFWSTAHPLHPLFHEAGHWLLFRKKGAAATDNLQIQKHDAEAYGLAAQISDYASYNKGEFLSEVFALLMAGGTMPEETLTLYKSKSYGGVVPRKKVKGQ